MGNIHLNSSKRGGFYLADWTDGFEDYTGNMVLNPGFENIANGAASNWNFYYAGYSISNLSHNGSYSIFMESQNESMVYGAYQEIVFNETLKKYPVLKISGWSRAENVSGEKNSDYSIYVDITYKDGSHLWGQVASFDTGSHDWQYAEKIVFLEKEVDHLYVYALFRYHSGKVWFDDVKITATDYEYVNASILEKNGKLYQHSIIKNLSFNVSYVSHDRYIEINGEIQSLSIGDKALTIYFSLPFNFTGWIWWNDIRNFEVINSTTYKNWKWFGEGRYISPYPFSCISNGDAGISYAVPLDNPIIYRISYSPSSYKIEFDIAFTNESKKANFSFLIYKNDYPEWGFRDTAKKYYEIFPQYFVKRVGKEGIWMPFVDISTVSNYSDFGFAFHEGDNNVSWDDAHEIYSFVYTEPWFYWQYMGDYTQKPDETDAINRLYENLNSSNEWRKRNSQAVITSGSYNKNGSYLFYITNAPWVGGSGWAALFDVNSDPDIVENGGYWNKAHVVWNLTINPSFERAYANDSCLDGIYLDSLQGYFWYMNNYRREHFRSITFPLSFDEEKKPCINELFTHYKFVKNVSDEMHRSNKLVMANSVGFYSAFFFPLLDVAGTETNWLPDGKYSPDSDEIFNFRRTLSYQKPFLLLMNTNFSLMNYSIVELYFKKCTFYGVYPSMFSHNACNDIYWENSTLYNRDRPLFKKYIPIIKEINQAGWQPVTFAKCNNSNVYVERYGNNYFTIHNPTNFSQKFTLMINKSIVGLDNMEILELIGNVSIPYSISNGSILINATIQSNDTWVLKIIPKAYYVAMWGDDASDGSFFAPWRTIQHAVSVANPGDTVYIRNGIYHENVVTTRNGSSAAYITFASFPGEKAIIDPGSGNGFTIYHSYIRVEGIKIQNCTQAMWITHAGNVEIIGCEICNVSFGIGFADGSHDFLLQNVDMHHFDYYGFDASPSGGKACYNGSIINCIAHDGRDTEQNVDGFALGHGTQHDFEFVGCEAYNVFDGFDISACNTTLMQCSAHECWNGGYKIWQDNVSLINCLAYNNSISNAELDWDGDAGVVTFQNCNFIEAGVYNIWIENSSDRLRMYNCILANGENIGLAFEERDASNYEGDYNIFHNSNAARMISVGYADEFSLDDVAAGMWSNYSQQDSHSLVCYDSSKLFVNISGWNFHLAYGSMAIDNGTAYNAPREDFDGVVRPQGNGVDIGAYEYLPRKKSMVYILPSHNCTDYWTKTYGDRIYYYVYANLSHDRWMIENDFENISAIYDRVIIVIPAENTSQYLWNLKIIDGIAEEFGLEVIYAIFPNEKYGREETYLYNGTKMHGLVLYDMNYLANLNQTYKVAIWYGWKCRVNAMDIINFYNSLPSILKSKYAVWLDEEYVEGVKEVYSYGLPDDVLFITEAYNKSEVQQFSCLYHNQMLVTGYEGATSLQQWQSHIEDFLSASKCNNIGIWMFYDIGDGAGEEYAAFINGGLANF